MSGSLHSCDKLCLFTGMNEQLAIIDFITRYITLSENEKAVILEQNVFRNYSKNELLLREGELPSECFFILKGSIRKFYLIDGEERNTEFYFENDAITPVGYVTKNPSSYFLSALEDTIVAIGTDERNKVLIERIPRLAGMVATMTTQQVLQTENTLDQFKTLNPENRYLQLIQERPDIFERVPLYHIATYLGITPVSLSRMRKRLLKS